MKNLLTPRQVAESLGVSESSLKRWCDRGVIEAVRTPGGHRKLPFDAVMRFLRDSDRPLAKPEALGLPTNIKRTVTIADANTELESRLLAGDIDRCRQLTYGLYIAGHSIAAICDRVFAPIMHRVGDGWECGDVEVYEEHRAVEILVLLLHDLRLVLASAAADAPLAIGGSIEGDCYDLPTRMVELTMRELGWRASSLGASLPFPTLVAAVGKTRPDLIWLSIAQFQREQQLIADVSAFYETLPQGTSLVIGGRAVTSELRQQLRATVFCDNLQQMSDFASTIYKNRSRRGNN